jgi:hypothetical protein
MCVLGRDRASAEMGWLPVRLCRHSFLESSAISALSAVNNPDWPAFGDLWQIGLRDGCRA